MKIRLSALTLILVFLMTVSVLAIPSAVAVVGSANEVDSAITAQSDAQLSAVVSATPGINVFTGNLKAETFDGFTQSDVDAMFTKSNSYITLSPATDPTYGTVIKVTSNANQWSNFYNLTSTSINRPAFYYMNYKLDSGAVAKEETAIWVVNLVGSTANFNIPATTFDTWLTTSKNSANYIWGTRLHTFNTKYVGDTTKSVYVDNYALVPWYKITYKNIDENGKSLGNDTDVYYIADNPASVTVSGTDIIGVSTSYPVDPAQNLINPNENLILYGWSTTQGATKPEKTVALNGQDIVLYPVWKDIGKEYVVYEDFEGVANGTIIKKYNDNELNSQNQPIELINKPFKMKTKGILDSATIVQGDQALDMELVSLSDGNTVLKASKVFGYSTLWRMITFNLTTTEGTGLTKALPGKYYFRLRYFIDANDPSAYASVSGRIGIDSGFTYVGSGKSVAKGKWHVYTQVFEIKDDGSISYGTSNVAFTKPIVRLDLVNSYSSNASDVLYYIDDISMTYAASRRVTLNYVDSNGKAIKSFDVLHYDGIGSKLVTAAELGLDYDACYTVNGKKYYPGQNVEIADDTNSINVTVSNTRVVYYESFDSVIIDSEGTLKAETSSSNGLTPEYLSPRFAEIGKVPFLNGGDSGASQKYKTIKESGRKVLAVQRYITGSKLHSMYFENLGFLGDGVYTYLVTYKMNGATLEKSSTDLQGKSKIAYNANGNKPENLPVDKDGYRTAKFNITIYTDTDGIRKVMYQPGKTYDFDASNTVGANVNRMMFYWWGADTTDEIIYLDEVAIEYTPFAPGKIDLKSYRNIAPFGMRFASYVDEVQKNKCTEYGFIATRKVFLENAATKAGTGTYTDYLYMENDDVVGTSTTLITNDDGVKIVGACNYNGVADKIYATDGADFGSSKYLGLNDSVKFFTGVIMGLEGEEQKEETFVVRPYVKIDGVYYYGEPLEASYNEVYNAFNG